MEIMSNIKPIPDGYHTVTPHIVVSDVAKAIEFYKKAFGAVQTVRMDGPGGMVLHAEVKIGNSAVMIAQENPEWGSKGPSTLGGSPVGLFIYGPDVDAAYKQAIDAGAKSVMEPADQFWGDRYCKVEDPFGHDWALGTHVEDVSEEDMAKRAQELFSKG
jgi:PhnB protein